MQIAHIYTTPGVLKYCYVASILARVQAPLTVQLLPSDSSTRNCVYCNLSADLLSTRQGNCERVNGMLSAKQRMHQCVSQNCSSD